MADEDALLTTRELSGRLNVPEGTLRYWRHCGYGPRGFAVGRTWRYRWSVVAAWLAKQEETRPEQPADRIASGAA